MRRAGSRAAGQQNDCLRHVVGFDEAIHGARYLEHGWFRLVREALIEREVMLRMAPHLIQPMRFALPVSRTYARPARSASACSSTIVSAAGRFCRRPVPSISRTPLGEALKRAIAAVLNIPTAGRTTRAWW